MWVGFSFSVHPRRGDNERVPMTTMTNTVMDTDTILRAIRRPPKIGKIEAEEKEKEEMTNHHHSIGLAVSWHYHCWFGVAFKSLRRNIYNSNRYGLSISNRQSTDIIVVIPIVRIVMVIRIMAIRIHIRIQIHIHIDLHTRIDLHRIKIKIPPRKKKCCNRVVNSIQNGKAPTRIRNYCRAKYYTNWIYRKPYRWYLQRQEVVEDDDLYLRLLI